MADTRSRTQALLEEKALGNSMAVPVMRWIGQRIQMVDEIVNDEATA